VRILDIDLDVFVTPINYVHSSTRLPDEDYAITPKTTIDHFLMQRCGLSSSFPKPGGVFEEHDELFDTLNELVQSKQLKVPFELVHVDAHADLGMGQWCPFEHLLTDLMHRPVHERTIPVRGQNGLNRGTVMLFIAACEWISKFHYVHHPDDGSDFRELLLDWNDETEQISLQIPKCTTDEMDRVTSYGATVDRWKMLSECCIPGRLIPFELSTIDSYAGPSDFDFVFLTRSPGFTPCKADAIFEKIRSMICPIGDWE
jgi:hypothetical protein